MTTTLAACGAQLDDKLDLNGRIHWQRGNPDGGASVLASLSEDLLHQFRSAIDHRRLTSEIRVRGDIADHFEHSCNLVDTD